LIKVIKPINTYSIVYNPKHIETMGYTVIIVGLCIIFAVVISVLNYYGNRKTSPWYVRLSLIIGWFFSFSIILVLPLDITSVCY